MKNPCSYLIERIIQYYVNWLEWRIKATEANKRGGKKRKKISFRQTIEIETGKTPSEEFPGATRRFLKESSMIICESFDKDIFERLAGPFRFFRASNLLCLGVIYDQISALFAVATGFPTDLNKRVFINLLLWR